MNQDVLCVSDVADFETRVGEAVRNGLFETQTEILISRAPGRLDVIGGFADYSGGVVLELPLANATFCAVQRRHDRQLQIRSIDPADDARHMNVAFNIDDAQWQDTAAAREWFAAHPDLDWAAYIVGVLVVMRSALAADIDCGASIFVHSRVPLGKGVSSSAALEVAVMQALSHLYQCPLDAETLAGHCQQVENHIVGAPCGLMDQMTSATGRADHLMCMCCQPAVVEAHIPLPAHLALWGIDSGIRHAVSGSDYSSVRIATYMGYRIIAALCGFAVDSSVEPLRISDPRWHNYLANISVEEWESSFREQIPEQMSGQEFIDRYTATHDHVTQVDPQATYQLRTAVAHPIYETQRVRRFAELLQPPESEAGNNELGQLMYQAHQSYTDNNIGSDGTDHLVRLVKELGPAHGLYGAKISGGGSGGTVAILGRADAQDAVQQVMQRYATQSGRQPELFSGSSPGAAAFGVQRCMLAADNSVVDEREV